MAYQNRSVGRRKEAETGTQAGAVETMRPARGGQSGTVTSGDNAGHGASGASGGSGDSGGNGGRGNRGASGAGRAGAAATFSHEEVARRAYRIWVEEGRPHGRAQEHWLRAERVLREEAARQPRTTRWTPSAARV